MNTAQLTMSGFSLQKNRKNAMREGTPRPLGKCLVFGCASFELWPPLFLFCRRGLSPQATSQHADSHAMGGHERERE